MHTFELLNFIILVYYEKCNYNLSSIGMSRCSRVLLKYFLEKEAIQAFLIQFYHQQIVHYIFGNMIYSCIYISHSNSAYTFMSRHINKSLCTKRFIILIMSAKNRKTPASLLEGKRISITYNIAHVTVTCQIHHWYVSRTYNIGFVYYEQQKRTN